MDYVYLASPYSHPEESVRNERFNLACQKAAQYIENGIAVFAPISHTHHIADFMEESARMDFELWMEADLPLVHHAKEVHVLRLEGWEKSRGIAREIEYATEKKIPVCYIDMEDKPILGLSAYQRDYGDENTIRERRMDPEIAVCHPEISGASRK